MKTPSQSLAQLRKSLRYTKTKMASYFDISPACYAAIEKGDMPLPVRLIASILRLAKSGDADKKVELDDFSLESDRFDLKSLILFLEQTRKRNHSRKYKVEKEFE